MSIFDNLLFDAFVSLITIYLLIFLAYWGFNKLFPNWKEWLSKLDSEKKEDDNNKDNISKQ